MCAKTQNHGEWGNSHAFILYTTPVVPKKEKQTLMKYTFAAYSYRKNSWRVWGRGAWSGQHTTASRVHMG